MTEVTTTTPETTGTETPAEGSETVASLFNAWHDLRTAASTEIAEFEVYKKDLEETFQRKADVVTVRNARYNQLLFIIERIKLNMEAEAAGKATLFPDITVDATTMLNEALDWLETNADFAPEKLMEQLVSAREADAAAAAHNVTE